MKKVFLLVAGCWALVAVSYCQSVSQRLQTAIAAFEKDEQLKHAISSLYVIDGATGQVVFDKNSQIGLAPASTQKIITSVTAFELLGKDYRYKTSFVLKRAGDEFKFIEVQASGDPTFGSWRFESTKEKNILETLFQKFRTSFLLLKYDTLLMRYFDFPDETPDGWIWQDIGNYYGASPSNFCWKENQYEIVFSSGESGSNAVINEIVPKLSGVSITNRVRVGKMGSGDNAYIYFSKVDNSLSIRGTIPPNQEKFSVYGAMPNPPAVFLSQVSDFFSDTGRTVHFKLLSQKSNIVSFSGEWIYQRPQHWEIKSDTIYTHYSPTLDSIIYWFNKKSINLYGESLLRTIGKSYESGFTGAADTSISVLRKFWKEKGLDEDELNICDGSGLSPLNRVTTHAQVEILKYAKSKDWFPYFYKSLPNYNGMVMKSGTISDVKGFCGYHKAKNGKEYIFSFLVNNYSGKSSALVGKMYKVLDELK